MTRPSFDPWLSHLRRDRRGLPVPFVNRWGPESTDRLYVAHDLWTHSRAVFLDDSAETEPDFTAQNMGRQRQCMAAGLCQVCARPVPWSRRNLVIAPSSVEWVPLGGRARLSVHRRFRRDHDRRQALRPYRPARRPRRSDPADAGRR